MLDEKARALALHHCRFRHFNGETILDLSRPMTLTPDLPRSFSFGAYHLTKLMNSPQHPGRRALALQSPPNKVGASGHCSEIALLG